MAAFERQLASIKEQCALLDVEIEQRRAVVMNLRRGMPIHFLDLRFVHSVTERERERSLLNTHASRTSPELKECEFRLQSSIEGVDNDKILIRFTHIDPSEPLREFSIVLDVSGDLYKGEGLIISLYAAIHLRPRSTYVQPFPAKSSHTTG